MYIQLSLTPITLRSKLGLVWSVASHEEGRRMAQVLVVEDDLDSRVSLRLALEDAGHMVTEAADGETALEQLLEAPDPLVVLLDHLMPHMTGLELLDLVSRNRDLAGRHAYVVVTAIPEAVRAYLEGKGTYLHVALIAKPFDLYALLEAVDQAAQRLVD